MKVLEQWEEDKVDSLSFRQCTTLLLYKPVHAGHPHLLKILK